MKNNKKFHVLIIALICVISLFLTTGCSLAKSIKQKFFWFLFDPMEAGNLISGSTAFSKSSLNIWKFSVHVLLKPGLDNKLSITLLPCEMRAIVR